MRCFVALLCPFLVLHCVSSQKKSSHEYPDILDLFPIEPLPKGRRSPGDSLNFDIDIERIDINKFKKKMEIFVQTLLRNVSLQETRRQKVPYYSGGQFNRASKHMMKAKTMDLMLQTIYMARHHVQQLEKEKFFSKTDTGYRIAFLFRRLRRIWRRMMDIYTLMIKNYHKFYEVRVEHIMFLHLKAIKLHTDFLYLWWVLITVDGKYTKRVKNTVARQTTKSTGSNLTAIEIPGEPGGFPAYLPEQSGGVAGEGAAAGMAGSGEAGPPVAREKNIYSKNL